jgi:hypothetical protein
MSLRSIPLSNFLPILLPQSKIQNQQSSIVNLPIFARVSSSPRPTVEKRDMTPSISQMTTDL